jgi:hypothetical protein
MVNPIVILLLHAIDWLLADCRCADAPIWRKIDASKPFEYTFSFVDDGSDGGCLGALCVQLVLHQDDELLASLMWPVLVEDVVEVQEESTEVLYLLVALDIMQVRYVTTVVCRTCPESWEIFTCSGAMPMTPIHSRKLSSSDLASRFNTKARSRCLPSRSPSAPTRDSMPAASRL